MVDARELAKFFSRFSQLTGLSPLDPISTHFGGHLKLGRCVVVVDREDGTKIATHQDGDAWKFPIMIGGASK